MKAGLAGLGVALALHAAAAPLPPIEDAQTLTIVDPRVTVDGLAWFAENKPGTWRLPNRMEHAVRPVVWSLAQDPSGARLRFVTDSTDIALSAQGSATTPSPNMSETAYAGVDLYADNAYIASAWPDKTGKIEAHWVVSRTARARAITIYLPLYQPISIRAISVARSAILRPAPAFALPKPVVYYGSSITQGAAASNPGMSFPALLGRWLNVDFVNLGFSGNGLGEPELARALAEIDGACYVVDYWANPSAESYRQTLPVFIDILRARHPRTPILVTGPYFNPSEDTPGEEGRRQILKRAFAREFVEARRKAGDSRITFVDGLEMISRRQSDALSDARHANTLGMYFCARGLEPYLKKALGM